MLINERFKLHFALLKYCFTLANGLWSFPTRYSMNLPIPTTISYSPSTPNLKPPKTKSANNPLPPHPPPFRKLFHSPIISTFPLKSPTRHTAQFPIYRLEIRVRETHEGVAQVIETMSDVCWVVFIVFVFLSGKIVEVGIGVSKKRF